MVVLPIAGRELAVAARRKSTYRVRVMVALLAILAGGSFMFMSGLRGVTVAGGTLFGILKFGAFAFSLFAGAFLTSDCLSEEKREGTIGLLFLTDLRGGDIVLGKLVSHSVGAVLGMAAMLPVMAMTISMGGVPPGEFWRVSLVLVNTLFFSLSLGVLVSSVSREQFQSFTRACAGAACFLVVMPLIAIVVEKITGFRQIRWACPTEGLRFAAAGLNQLHGADFWGNLGVIHMLGWMFLGGASHFLPRRWMDAPARPSIANPAPFSIAGWVPRPKKRPGLNRELLDLHPILAMAEARREVRRLVWLLAVLGAAFALMVWAASGSFGLPAIWALALLGVPMKALFAWQACRFFAEARRMDAMELILGTPLSDQQILDGQWLALKRAFLRPAILLWGTPLVVFILHRVAFGHGNFSWRDGAAWGGTLLMLLYKLAVFTLDLRAIGWTGMWFALTDKRPNLSFFKVLLIVVVVPGVIFFLPGIIPALIILTWSRRKFRSSLRDILERQRVSR